MKESDKKLLELSGWIVECESPFEISMEADPQSRATGYGANMILDYLKICCIVEGYPD